MGQFYAFPGVVAVVADRLVSIVSVDDDASVVIRDLASGKLSRTSAADLSAPPALSEPTAPALSSIVQASDAQWASARRREAVIAAIQDAEKAGDQGVHAAAQLGVSRRTLCVFQPIVDAVSG